jgi:hypothetical protein
MIIFIFEKNTVSACRKYALVCKADSRNPLGYYNSSADTLLYLGWLGSCGEEERQLIIELLKMQKHQELVIGCGMKMLRGIG